MDTAFIESMNINSSYILYSIGVIESLAGKLVFLRPKIGAYFIMTWLAIIASFFFIQGKYMDVALRCVVMAVGALALGHLSHLFNSIKTNTSVSTVQHKPKKAFYNTDKGSNV
jgi:hypothetical protein